RRVRIGLLTKDLANEVFHIQANPASPGSTRSRQPSVPASGVRIGACLSIAVSAKSPRLAHSSFTSAVHDRHQQRNRSTGRSSRGTESEHSIPMNGRTIARVLLLVVLIAGAIGL